jgi:dTMP kinase
MFVVIDGPEATGKTTLARLLAAKFQAEGRPVLLTKEPGSEEPVCAQIRSLLLSPGSKIQHSTALCLFLADRCQHMVEIQSALDAGKVVISDRSSFSSFAYYAASRPEDSPAEVAKEIGPMLDFAQKVRPDWCFVCSADFEWSLAKLRERGSLDRIEQLGQDFHRHTHRLFAPTGLRHLQTAMRQAPEKTVFLSPAQTKQPEMLLLELWDYLAFSLPIF